MLLKPNTMRIIQLGKRLYHVPDEWNKLTGPQLVKLLKVLQRPSISLDDRLLLFRILTGMSWRQFFQYDAVELNEFLYLVEFLFQKNTLTKNLLPEVKGYYGPSDDFSNLRMNEFVFSEEHYLQWKSNEANEEPLNQLVAVLYRRSALLYNKKVNPKGDVRISFNQNLCTYNAKKIAKWPRKIKQAIVFWYEGCREKLKNDFPEVYSGGDGEGAKYGLVSSMLQIAETGVFGKFEEVENQYVRLVLVQVDEKLRQIKEDKKSINNG